MNKTVIAIRDLRTQLQALEKRIGTGDEAKPLVTASTDLRKKISAIEEELVQVNSKSSEDQANYPTMLNSKLGHLQSPGRQRRHGPHRRRIRGLRRPRSTPGSPADKMARSPCERPACAQRLHAQKQRPAGRASRHPGPLTYIDLVGAQHAAPLRGTIETFSLRFF